MSTGLAGASVTTLVMASWECSVLVMLNGAVTVVGGLCVPVVDGDNGWIHPHNCAGCKGNLMIKHNAQILAGGIQSILDKYNTAEGCIPCKGDPKRKL